MVTGNAPGVTVVCSLMGPGGADTALIFGSTKVIVCPPCDKRKRKRESYKRKNVSRKRVKKIPYISQNLARYLRHLLLVCPNYPWHAKAHFSTLVDTEGTLVFDFADNGQLLILVSKFILVQKTVRSDNLLSKGKKNIC